MRNAAPGSKVHDVARLEYTVKAGIVPEDPEDIEKKVSWLRDWTF